MKPGDKYKATTAGETLAKSLNFDPGKNPDKAFVKLLQAIKTMGGTIYPVTHKLRMETHLAFVKIQGEKDFEIVANPDGLNQHVQMTIDIAKGLYFYEEVSQKGKIPLEIQCTWKPITDHTYLCEYFAAGFCIPRRILDKTPAQKPNPYAIQTQGIMPHKYCEMRLIAELDKN